MKSWLFRIGGAVLLVMGIIAAVRGIPEARDAYESADWPTTVGVLLESKVHDTTIETAYKRSGRPNRARFHHVVAYRYTVDGVDYDGSRKDFDDGWSDTEFPIPNAGVAASPPPSSATEKKWWNSAAPIAVHYKPSEPSVSVLDPGMRMGAFFTSGGGVIMIFGGLFLLFTGRWFDQSQ